MTPTQRWSLIECIACHEERIRYGMDGRFRTRDLSGTRAQRSTTTLRSLERMGYLTSWKTGPNGQSKVVWQVTPAGLEAGRTA